MAFEPVGPGGYFGPMVRMYVGDIRELNRLVEWTGNPYESCGLAVLFVGPHDCGKIQEEPT